MRAASTSSLTSLESFCRRLKQSYGRQSSVVITLPLPDAQYLSTPSLSRLSLSLSHTLPSLTFSLSRLFLSPLSLSLPSPRRLPPSPSSLSIAWACSDDAPAPLRLKGRVPRGGLPRRPPELRVRGRWARGPRTWEAQCGGECALVMRTGPAAHSFCYCEGEGEGGGRVTE